MSNAAERSNISKIADDPASNADKMSFCTLIKAVSVDVYICTPTVDKLHPGIMIKKHFIGTDITNLFLRCMCPSESVAKQISNDQ